jgi:hypothetical protein
LVGVAEYHLYRDLRRRKEEGRGRRGRRKERREERGGPV